MLISVKVGVALPDTSLFIFSTMFLVVQPLYVCHSDRVYFVTLSQKQKQQQIVVENLSAQFTSKETRQLYKFTNKTNPFFLGTR